MPGALGLAALDLHVLMVRLPAVVRAALVERFRHCGRARVDRPLLEDGLAVHGFHPQGAAVGVDLGHLQLRVVDEILYLFLLPPV
eukprot:1747580-Lingulodinium_polyedra.AAC.1